MPAQKKTTLGLNQWIGSEYPKRVDFVEDNKIINDELENRVKYTDLAEENKAGIITYAKIKEIAPRPDLSPYIPFSKGYRNSNNSDYIIRANATDCWTPRHIYMYLENGAYMGCFHTNGGRAYYKVPNRNGGNWCEIMDNHDMAARDNNIQHAHNRITDTWNRANDAWNRTQDLYNRSDNDTVRDIRLVGFIELVRHNNGAVERAGYVVTGIKTQPSNQDFWVQMRALQERRGGGGQNWYNTPFG